MAPSGRGGGQRPQQQPQQSQSQAPQPNAQLATPDVLSMQRGRFVQWQPAPVICSAATADGTVAAVGREDGTVELWDTLSWQLLKVRCCYCVLVEFNNGHSELAHRPAGTLA